MTELIVPLFAVFVAFNGAIPFILAQIMVQKNSNTRANHVISTIYKFARISFGYCWLVWFFLCLAIFIESEHNVLFILLYIIFGFIPIFLICLFTRDIKLLSSINS